MKKSFLAVLFLALILRLTLFFFILKIDPNNFCQSDSGVYLQIADNLLKTGTFSSSSKAPFEPEYNRTPAYPVFLAPFRAASNRVNSIILFQVFLSILSVYLVMYFCRQLLQLSVTASALAGLVLALDVPSIVLANSVLTETLVTFLLLSGVILTFRYFKTGKTVLLVISGVIYGLSSLCRPSALLLPVFILVALFFAEVSYSRKGILSLCLFIIAYTAVLSPWLIRNKAIFGGAFLSTISYDNLLYVQAAGVKSVHDRVSLDETRRYLVKDFESRNLESINAGNLLKIKKLEGKEAVEIIKTHPLIYAYNYCRSVLNMLLRPIRNDIDLMLGLTQTHSTLELWDGAGPAGMIKSFFSSTSRFTAMVCLFQIAALAAIYYFAIYGVFAGYTQDLSLTALLLSFIIYFCLTFWRSGDIREVQGAYNATGIRICRAWYRKIQSQEKRRMTKIGIIGCGYWGPNLVRNFMELTNCEVAAISDLNADRLKSIGTRYPQVARFSDYNDILKNPEITGVVISTNLTTHYAIAKDALNAGKHILLEKPVASTVSESAELVALAKKKKLIFMSGHTFLYNQGVIDMKKYVEKGDLGDVFYLHSERTNLGPIRNDTNALWDLAPHDISIFMHVLGHLPCAVSAHGLFP